VWTLDQAMQATRGGNWPVNGPFYIEDVFNTWLYTGNGGTQTINNGINLSGNGGMVWSKCRSSDLGGNGIHTLIDTIRGAGNRISSDLDGGQVFNNNTITAFSSNGFSIGNSPINNTNAATFVSWAFREQPRFFDIVTYTGDGGARNIAHNLGSVPGCIIIKRTDAAADWVVYHRSTGNTQGTYLNSMAVPVTSSTFWENTTPTSTTFRVGVASRVNAAGGTYVAYLFAHNAGGFGLTGTDNVISCGSYTGNGSTNGPTIDLGYEPQWILNRRTNDTGNWQILDTMRGLSYSIGGELSANQISAEGATASGQQKYGLLANGFQVITTDNGYNNSGSTYIYIAIRRGPMRVPTTGTRVFAPATRTGTGGTSYSVTTNTTPDSIWLGGRTQARGYLFFDRLRGLPPFLRPYGAFAEVNNAGYITSMTNQGYISGTDTFMNGSGELYIDYLFTRAPGFFDEVCYTGTGANRTVAHNLAAVPELMIVKTRNASANWPVYSSAVGNDRYLTLDGTNGQSTATSGYWNSTDPTTTVFSLGTNADVNASGLTYVAYLFASCAGVSRVGSYTGTGTTQVINCGFTGGSRFVLIKRTSTTGDWLVWDSARGIVAGNDPYLELNTTDAEVTTTDWVDTASTGFELSNAGGNLANSNGVSYIFLAIA
jgi:hypothetical protein